MREAPKERVTTTVAASGVSLQPDLVHGVELADGAPVVLVDVPGVPLVGDVAVQLEPQALLAGGDGLPAAGRVHQGGELAGPVDDQAEDAVVQAVRRTALCVGLLRDRHRAGRGVDHACPQRGHARAGVRGRVEQQRLVALADQRMGGRGDDPLGPLGDGGVVAFGVGVHPGDRAARQDVVELLQQHQLPQLLQLGRRVVPAQPDGRRRRPQLGFAEQVLAAPVALLGTGLAGVGAPVQLQVHLPGPHRGAGVLGLGVGEEAGGGAQLHGGRPLQRLQPVRGGEHVPVRPAPAVAVAERAAARSCRGPSRGTAAPPGPGPRRTAWSCRCPTAGSG